jgi:ribosomal protein S18 acetylase RimI-like enzyme
MRLIHWHDAGDAQFGAIWAEQNARWTGQLSWDSAGTWDLVEAQRKSGRLPGVLLLDGPRVAAWSFFLVHDNTLQIGAFEADTCDTTGMLLDAILETVDPADACDGAMLFAFSTAPGLLPALIERGFDVERYFHLLRELPADDRATTGSMKWSSTANEQVPVLLARAYGEPSQTRPFARHGRDTEWREYVGHLLGSNACGRFDPSLSSACMSPSGVLHALTITTVVAPGTAHIAQLAVDPLRRGAGLASAMLHEVVANARRAGCERLTLLVSERNRPALRLYQREGFRQTANFVSAGRGAWESGTTAGGDYPRRSTSPAFEMGGASTFR